MKHIHKLILGCLLVLAAEIAAGQYAYGAAIELTSQAKDLSVESQFEVSIQLNTEGENLNAVSGSILFPSDTLALQAIRDGDSVVNFWIIKPTEAPFTDKLSSVRYSGTIPGGYNGTGKLFSLVFQAIAPTSAAQITAQELVHLKHDGRGTLTTSASNPLLFQIQAKTDSLTNPDTSTLVIPLTDTTAPLLIEASVVQDRNLYDNKWVVIFFTVDPESGIDHYEIQESNNPEPTAEPWRTVASPEPLADQSRAQWVHIKAVNRAGLSTIRTLEPKANNTTAKPTITTQTAGISLGVIILLSAVFTAIRSRLKNKPPLTPSSHDPAL